MLGGLALRGYEVNAQSPVYYTHGVASGDPLSDRVILWTRVLAAQRDVVGEWQVATDVAFTHVVARGAAHTHPARDNTVKIDAQGLQPGARYWYRFIFDGVPSPVGRTCTLPEGSVDAFNVAVCSCSNYPQGYFNAYRDIAKSDVDIVMHLGDYLYEYEKGTYSNPIATDELGRQVQPDNEILSLDDYRQRYGVYRTDPDLQAAHAAHPWICVWDDHELANDTWHSGAENHNEGDGDFAQRIAIARRVYHEWMPIRTAAQTDQGPIYRRFQVGDLADLIMLDTRLVGRDRQLDYRHDMTAGMSPEQFKNTVLADPQRTMIGAEQSHWLGAQLAASKARGATWQFIGQQVLMGKLFIPQLQSAQLETADIPDSTRAWIDAMMKIAPFKMPMNLDAWDGYPACRERVFTQLLEDANNPVVVAGDTHNAWAFNLRNAQGKSVGVEIGCSSVSSPGIEAYLPVPTDTMANALLESSPELVAVDASRRGWAKVTLTPQETLSQWRFVDTILSRDYSVIEMPALRCAVGDRRFS